MLYILQLLKVQNFYRNLGGLASSSPCLPPQLPPSLLLPLMYSKGTVNPQAFEHSGLLLFHLAAAWIQSPRRSFPSYSSPQSVLYPLYTRPVQKVSSHVTWKIQALTEEDTRYKKHCTQDKDSWVPFKVGTLGPHTVPVTISSPIIFSWITSTVWNLFPVKDDFSLGKSRKSQGTKSGL